MKRILSLALLSLVLGGCVLVPAGRYDGDGYRGQGYYRGDSYRDEGHYRRDGYRDGYGGYYRGDGYYRGYYGYPYRDHSQ
jgi:hypothetical protein